MNMLESFILLLEKEREKELLPFLKSLSPTQRKDLAQPLPSLAKEYFATETVTVNGSTHYRTKGTPIRRRMLSLAAFVCCNRRDYEKVDPWGGVIEPDLLRPVLDWYCPDWLSGLLNEYADRDYLPYRWGYHWIMELADKQLILPSRELLAKLLPPLLYEQTNHHNQWQYCPENLLKREVTLREHLWYLFELETTVHWQNRYTHFSGLATGETGWITALKTYAAEGRIERDRLLRESLLATTRNFNKTLSGWFADLFTQLEPTPEELLTLQPELFIAFNSPQTKPVNTALQGLKRITELEGFRVERLLENTSLLLSSQTKSIVITTLQILEKVAKRFSEQREAVCLAACQALVHSDGAIQEKAAKLIVRFGEPSSQALTEAVAPYVATLLLQPRTLLAAFIPHHPVPAAASLDSVPHPNPSRLREELAIPPVVEFDDLLYLASQAFDNHESYHLDLLPAALISLQDQIRGAQIAQLEPAFQRAYKLLMDGGQGKSGVLDHLLATFLVEYALLLIKVFPRDAQSLKALHERYAGKDQAMKAQYSFYSLRIGSLAGWQTYGQARLCEPFKQLLLEALERLRTRSSLPLLSTPTHAPGWLSPLVFMDRLQRYQEAGAVPHGMDLQMAISRLALENREQVLPAVHARLEGEFRNLLVFLFDESARPQGPYTQPKAWVMASLVKNPSARWEALEGFCPSLSDQFLTGQPTWRVVAEPFSYQQYDYRKGKTIQVHKTNHRLSMDLPGRKPMNGFKVFLSKLLSTPQPEEPLLYELLSLTERSLSVGSSDIRRLLLLVPNHPEPVLAQLLHTCLRYSTGSEDTYKHLVIRSLETLLDIWRPMGKTAHLLVATCLVSRDKTVRALAAEIWINGVGSGTIDSGLVGECLGKLQAVEFAPLKRLTDTLTQHLLRVSDRHSLELESMLTGLLLQLPPTPIHQLRKLLEIYLEVLASNDTLPGEKVIGLLTGWKTGSGLQKVVGALESRKTSDAIRQRPEVFNRDLPGNIDLLAS